MLLINYIEMYVLALTHLLIKKFVFPIVDNGLVNKSTSSKPNWSKKWRTDLDAHTDFWG